MERRDLGRRGSGGNFSGSLNLALSEGALKDGMAASLATRHSPDAEFAFRMAFTLAPTIEAIILFWGVGAINLLWSSIFGLAGHLIEWNVPHERSSALHILGVFVWPIAIWTGLYVLSGWVWHASRHVRFAAVALFVVSLCVVVPNDGILIGPFKYEGWPLYVRLLAD